MFVFNDSLMQALHEEQIQQEALAAGINASGGTAQFLRLTRICGMFKTKRYPFILNVGLLQEIAPGPLGTWIDLIIGTPWGPFQVQEHFAWVQEAIALGAQHRPFTVPPGEFMKKIDPEGDGLFHFTPDGLFQALSENCCYWQGWDGGIYSVNGGEMHIFYRNGNRVTYINEEGAWRDQYRPNSFFVRADM